ncbi:MAG TPA: acyltransferase [Cytophagaceae bacterium]
MTPRLSGLDYLRGLCALGVMVFHYSLWTIGVESSSNILTRIGIYGVSIFYVLSGLTLYHVYELTLRNTSSSLKLFYLKRFLRIFPLLWFATWLKILLWWELPRTETLITNLTGLFAVYKWHETFAFGAWSIGNELVFYLLFPIFLSLTRKSAILFHTGIAITLTIYLVFAFFILDSSIPFLDQWPTYTNPLNQLFLFASGIWLGYVFKNITVSQTLLRFVLLAALLTFVFYPITGERIELITGSNRIILTITAISSCLAFYKMQFNFPNLIDYPLSKLGHCSYSLYLLHAILFKAATKISEIWGNYVFQIPISLFLPLAGIATIMVSYAVYYYFESYFTKRERQIGIYESLERISFRKNQVS